MNNNIIISVCGTTHVDFGRCNLGGGGGGVLSAFGRFNHWGVWGGAVRFWPVCRMRSIPIVIYALARSQTVS